MKIIRILTDENSEREARSAKSLEALGLRTIKIVQKPYDKIPPSHNVYGGNSDWVKGITKPIGTFGLTSGHYGAYLGHRMAIMSSFADSEHTIICECDCIIPEPEVFKTMLDEAVSVMTDYELKIVRFEAPDSQVKFYEKLSANIYTAEIMTLGHCYMVNPNEEKFYSKAFSEVGWHTPDWWLNFAFRQYGEYMGAFKDMELTMQAGGKSMIDNIELQDRIR